MFCNAMLYSRFSERVRVYLAPLVVSQWSGMN